MQDYSSPRPSPSLTCPLGASGPPGRLSPALTWSPSWFSFDQLTIPMATGWCCLCQAASAAPFCCTCSLSLATWLRSRPSTQRAPVFQPAARRQRQKVPKGGSVPASLLSPSTLLTCLSVCLPAERGPVRTLQVSQETTHSFRVSWQPAPGEVTYYRLSYHPLEGKELQGKEVTTSGPETTVVLTGLLPQTTYRVTVTPEYQSGAGEPLEVDGLTREGQQIFQNPTCRGH